MMKHQPIIPWMGGKRRLVDKILPLFPDHQCYVEPFAGSAAMLFAKDPAKSEVLNDINGDIVNLYRVVQHHLDEFVRQFRWALASREMFGWLGDTPPATLTDIQKAARFFYLQKLAFGGKVSGRNFGTATTAPPKLNLLRVEEELSQAHLRLARVTIERLDWQALVRKYDRPHTLFYLDPPYWQTAGYGVDFGLEQYQEMAGLMGSIQGKAIVSINDHPDMRAAFKGFKMSKLAIQYSVGNPRSGGRGKVAGELVIKSW